VPRSDGPGAATSAVGQAVCLKVNVCFHYIAVRDVPRNDGPGKATSEGGQAVCLKELFFYHGTACC